ncbi:flagellar type III secretion system pore protein FliP [Timonella sp. A28]|uniref:flagellar type III secretion system pore protein FliP n=1 Tax=Timonella sp. A28 TaxID=3442640 RepID=UPI003EC07A6A
MLAQPAPLAATTPHPAKRHTWLITAITVVFIGFVMFFAAPAGAVPIDPVEPVTPSEDLVNITIDGEGKPSASLTVLIAITFLSVAPSLLLMMTSFTKILIVLSMTRNALGLQGVPPNQVLAGIALILTIFIMGPVLTEINDVAIQPYLAGDVDFSAAVEVGREPLRTFMLGQTRESDIALLLRAAGAENPATPEDVGMLTLIPAFLLSEIRAAFIIGFVIFLPFLIIDLVVSAALMSMGMMMLPPVMISLPFKILLFVLVDGWSLIVTSLVGSYT